MSKDWEKPSDRNFVSLDDYIGSMDEIIVKQRTRIFKEVREKVIGKKREEVDSVDSIGRRSKDYEAEATNELKDKQLKKLKELEEGR